MFIVGLVLVAITCLGDDKKKKDKPLSKAEQAVQAGKDVHKVNPNAAKKGEHPNCYANPGHDDDHDHGKGHDKDKDKDKDHKKGH